MKPNKYIIIGPLKSVPAWVWDVPGRLSCIGLIGFTGLIGFVGFIGFIGFIGPVGFMKFIYRLPRVYGADNACRTCRV